MEWLIKLFSLFRGNTAETTRAIIEGFKELNREYKEKINYQESRIRELEEMKGTNLTSDEINELLEREKQDLMQIIQLLNENRDLREHIIFLEKMKNVSK